MPSLVKLDPRTDELYCAGRRWTGWRQSWQPVGTTPEGLKKVAARVGLTAALKANPYRGLPIGIIGPKIAGKEQLSAAERLGGDIAAMNVPLLCGGKTGVMEAACKGAKSRGGLTIGLLPDEDWTAANDYVDIPLASGIGPSRNAIIARACPVLIAIGGEYGTLSEVAFGLHFGRRVICLCGAPDVAGVSHAAGIDEALELAAAAYLNLDKD